MKVWRVEPRVDKLGNQLWSLQYDVIWRDGRQYNIWNEDRVFRSEDRAMEDLAFVREGELI
ncbi:hypothetical protein [Mycobacterium phage WXIN]|nr:hypothetical protein [Mycobacterium phage WXIN]